MTLSTLNAPVIERHRHDTRRRTLTVTANERLSPVMLRLRLAGPDLDGFLSLSPADHLKLIVPDGAGGTTMRDYTPRRHDIATGELWIDFAIHDAGPATLWALAARPGDRVEIGGPRGSQVIVGPIGHWLLIGDETALPSIARRIEELGEGDSVTSLIAVPGPEDEQSITTTARHRAIWVHRAGPADPAPLIAALAGLPLAPSTFVWIAAEAGVARALRDDLLDRGHRPGWMKVAGYWVKGEADAADKAL